MKAPLATRWTPLDEIPRTSAPEICATEGSPRKRVTQGPQPKPKIGGSEGEKRAQCSKALWSLCHGGTIREASAHSGLSELQVHQIYHAYGIRFLIANSKHQTDDGIQIGPWVNSRLYQSGYERYKNDFHSYFFLYSMGLSCEETLQAVCTWQEFRGIKSRLIRDYPATWREFALADIRRCVQKFASYRGPALVRKRTLVTVAKAVTQLNKQSFRTSELLPMLKLSVRQLQRALSQLPNLTKKGFKRGSHWEILNTSQKQRQGAAPLCEGVSK